MNPQIRLKTKEHLDDLSLSGKPLDNALSSLKLINTFFGNHKQLGNAVVAYCKSNNAKKEFSIVDLGCGGGDSITYISKKLTKNKIRAHFIGIDGNPESISYAREHNIDSKKISFIVADILDNDFMIPDCDILISSHFIYHFDNQHLTHFLKKLQSETVKHIIFSELYRDSVAYYLFKMVRFALPISDIAKKDGLIAIQRAFSISEMKRINTDSGVKKFEVIKKPFFRMITKIDL